MRLQNDRRRALLGFPLIDHHLVGGSDPASEFRRWHALTDSRKETFARAFAIDEKIP